MDFIDLQDIGVDVAFVGFTGYWLWSRFYRLIRIWAWELPLKTLHNICWGMAVISGINSPDSRGE